MSIDTNRFASPAFGDFASHLRAVDFLERQWRAAEGFSLAGNTRTLADIERALSGLVAVNAILRADDNARFDVEASEPAPEDRPAALGTFLRSELLDAQFVLLKTAHKSLCVWRESCERALEKTAKEGRP